MPEPQPQVLVLLTHGLHAAVEPLAAKAREILPDRGTARDAEGNEVLPGQDRPRGAPVPKEPLDATASRCWREEPGTGELDGGQRGEHVGDRARASGPREPLAEATARHRRRQGAPGLARDRQAIETGADHPRRLAGEQRDQREVTLVDHRARGARTLLKAPDRPEVCPHTSGDPEARIPQAQELPPERSIEGAGRRRLRRQEIDLRAEPLAGQRGKVADPEGQRERRPKPKRSSCAKR